jgi:hypothetical protein
MTPGSASSRKSSVVGDADNTALNAQFSSYGNLAITFDPSLADTIPKRSSKVKKFADLKNNSSFVSGTMTEIASQVMFTRKRKSSILYHSLVAAKIGMTTKLR